MAEYPKTVEVMTSHFANVLGVEASDEPMTEIDADAIIEAYRNFDEVEDLENSITELLTNIVKEISSMDLSGIKTLYKFAEDDAEREEAARSAEMLGQQIQFFTHVLTELRKLIVEKYNDAHMDPRHLTPMFQEAMELIQEKAERYNKQIDAFWEMVNSRSRGS